MNYRAAVNGLIMAHKDRKRFPLCGPLVVKFEVFPPDRRRRDFDNILKTVQDALTKAKLWEDDSLFIDENVREGEPEKLPFIGVRVRRATPDEVERKKILRDKWF